MMVGARRLGMAGIFCLLLGCGGEAEPPSLDESAKAPEVPKAERAQAPDLKGPIPRATRGYILISIDTLRADRLGCYGYPRPTSPFVDSLAERATLVDARQFFSSL